MMQSKLVPSAVAVIVCCAVVCCWVQCVRSSSNTTASFPSMDIDLLQDYKSSHSRRKQRFISFDSKDGDVTVELAFNVPFLRIPVKTAMDNLSEGLPMASVNVGSIILAGALSFGALIVIPGLLGLFNPKKPGHVGYRAVQESEWWRVVSSIEDALNDNNIDSTSCMQRAICWMVKNSSQKVSTGRSYSTDKIIDGIASNPWVQKMLRGTVIKDALEAGYQGYNCSSRYENCKLNEMSFQKFVKIFQTYRSVNHKAAP